MVKVWPEGTQGGPGKAGQPAGKQAAQPLRGQRRLVLRSLLQDTYEFIGINHLVFFLAYFVYAIVFIGSSWSQNKAVFNAEMMNAFQSYGPADWQQTQLGSQLLMADAFDYALGFTAQLLADADGRGSDTELYMGQYTKISYIRLVANVDSSCEHETLHCYQSDPDSPMYATSTNTSSPMPSGLWEPVQDNPYFCYGYGIQHGVTIYNASDTSVRFQDINETLLQALASDRAFIGRYAMTMQLNILANYDREWESDSAQLFALQWFLTETLWIPSLDIQFNWAASTLSLKTTFVTSGIDAMRLAMLCIYILLITWSLLKEVDEIRLSAHQYAIAAYMYVNRQVRDPHAPAHHEFMDEGQPSQAAATKYVRKMARLGVWRYFLSPWNVVDIASTLVSFMWAFGWLYIVFYAYNNSEALMNYMDSEYNLHLLMQFSATFNVFIWIGILNILLIGVRLYKYMRFHRGLAVYYTLFVIAWRAIKDFAIWFIYVMLVLSSVVIMMFQNTGGNNLFSVRAEGINGMALVTFGLMDYETFTNDFMGVGSWKPVITLVFWLGIAILGTLAMNILIAIVSSAYEEARKLDGAVEMTLIYIIFLRFGFYTREIWSLWILRESHETFVRKWVDVVSKEINTDPNRQLHDFRYSKAQPWVSMKVARVYARWALSQIPEVRVLLTYFMDASNTTLCMRSPWEDGEAVEEEMTDTVQLLRGQGPALLPFYAWTIDSHMTRSEFTTMLLALASSGVYGLPYDYSTSPSSKAPSFQDLGSLGFKTGKPDESDWETGSLHMQFPLTLPTCSSPAQVAMQNVMLTCCMPCLASPKSRKAPDQPARDIETGLPAMGLHMPSGVVLDAASFTALVRLVDQEQAELEVVADSAFSASVSTPPASPVIKATTDTGSIKPVATGLFAESDSFTGGQLGGGAQVDLTQQQGEEEEQEEGRAQVEAACQKWGVLMEAWLAADQQRSAAGSGLFHRGSQEAASLTTFLFGMAAMRHAGVLSRDWSPPFMQILSFRRMGGLMPSRARWRMSKVVRLYASWIWEVYSADLQALQPRKEQDD